MSNSSHTSESQLGGGVDNKVDKSVCNHIYKNQLKESPDSKTIQHSSFKKENFKTCVHNYGMNFQFALFHPTELFSNFINAVVIFYNPLSCLSYFAISLAYVIRFTNEHHLRRDVAIQSPEKKDYLTVMFKYDLATSTMSFIQLSSTYCALLQLIAFNDKKYKYEGGNVFSLSHRPYKWWNPFDINGNFVCKFGDNTTVAKASKIGIRVIFIYSLIQLISLNCKSRWTGRLIFENYVNKTQ